MRSGSRWKISGTIALVLNTCVPDRINICTGCDNENDKGIDALYVDDVEKVIICLQSKRKATEPPTAGDNDIKKLVGSMQQLKTIEGVEEVYDTGNADLKMLIDRFDIRCLVEEGYSIRGVFITNAARDGNTRSYLRSIEETEDLQLFDREEIYKILQHIEAPEFVEGPCTLRLRRLDSFEYTVSSDSKMVVGLVLATEIIRLPGIDDLSLFAHNVRLDLGNTRINKSIGTTLHDPSEHSHFPTFHNGLTIVCKSLNRPRGKVVLRDLSVVNGCQSVRALARNKSHLTSDLKVLVKIVEVKATAGQQAVLDTIERITFRSNNQNSVNMRDLRSGDEKQRALVSEVHAMTNGRIAFAIQRGKQYEAEQVINNDLAAQLLVSIYVGKPWIAHQKSKLFDSEYDKVFTRHVYAQHILLADLMYQSIVENLCSISNASVAGYQLTVFVLLHALVDILKMELDGQALLHDPTLYLTEDSLQSDLRSRLDRLAKKLMVDMNYYMRQETERDPQFDYKRGFKQKGAVERFVSEAIRGYEKNVIDNPANKFTLPPIEV